MRLTLSLIAVIVALGPSLSFGQVSDLLEIRNATKDAFSATSKAFDSIEANQKKQNKGKPTAGKQSKPAAQKSGTSSGGSGTLFSRLGAQAEQAETSGAMQKTDGPSEQEKQLLSFLSSWSGFAFQAMLGVVGLAVAWCIGVRIKEKMRDYPTGRPSLSKCRIVRR